MKLLIFGLPGSGKTTLAKNIKTYLNWPHFNADEIRQQYDDWDFSETGRIRQANRLILLATTAQNSIVDFVCPYKQYRNYFDFTIFMNTIKCGRYEDTNSIFEPSSADLIINSFDYDVMDIISQIEREI